MGSGYTCLWEFLVAPEMQPDFERHYNADGTWVRLFRRAPGYIDTLLLKDRSMAGRYVTVDRWQSKEAYLAFRTEFSLQYAELDRECERFTIDEILLGEFSE